MRSWMERRQAPFLQTPGHAARGTHPRSQLNRQHPPEKAEPLTPCSHLRTVAKTSHFAHQVAIHQHAVGRERAVHEGEAGQVLHGGGHSPLHGHQLQAAELALPLLLGAGGRGQLPAAGWGTSIGQGPDITRRGRRGLGNQKMALGRMKTRGGVSGLRDC